MSDELMRRIRGETRTPKYDRETTAAARAIHNEAQLATFKAQAIDAVAARQMELMLGLNEHRKDVAGDDPVMQAICADFQQTALQKNKDILRNLFPMP